MKKNKKAQTQMLWKVLGYLFSALVIIFLIYFLVRMFYVTSGETDMQKMSKVLLSTQQRINYIKNSGVLQDILMVFPIKGWSMKSFSGVDTPSGECLNNRYCLCICDDTTCNGNRNCTGFDFEVQVVGSVTTTIPGGGYMQPAGIDVISNNIIKFENAVESIKLNSDGTKISLSK